MLSISGSQVKYDYIFQAEHIHNHLQAYIA